LCRLDDARLGRRVADHRDDPCPQHRSAVPRLPEQFREMSLSLAQSLPPRPETMAQDGLLANVAPFPVKVQIRNVGFHYGKFHAVKNISMPLYDRKVTAFIGPSGCGKSTLL